MGDLLRRFLGTNETHDVFTYASVNDRVEDQVLSLAWCPEGFTPLAGTSLDCSQPTPRVVINVSDRAHWTDEIAYEVAHELSHAVYDVLQWAQKNPSELAALDLSRDRTHDKDGGIAPS